MPAPAQAPPGALSHSAGREPVPSLSRSAVERVLARAAELDAELPAAEAGHTDDTISELRLLEIAREVGLSTAGVRQALAEERTRVALDDTGGEQGGWLAHLAGPAVVSATRVVRPDITRGGPDAVIAALDRWMRREECLRVQRHFPDRIVWEPRSDWPGVLKRALRFGGRPYQLCRTRQVSATVVPAEDDAGVIVRLEADVTPRRAMHVRLGATATTAGVALATTIGGLGLVAHAATGVVAAAAAVPAGVSAAAAYVLLKGHRGFAARTKLALEQVLDRIADAHSHNR